MNCTVSPFHKAQHRQHTMAQFVFSVPKVQQTKQHKKTSWPFSIPLSGYKSGQCWLLDTPASKNESVLSRQKQWKALYLGPRTRTLVSMIWEPLHQYLPPLLAWSTPDSLWWNLVIICSLFSYIGHSTITTIYNPSPTHPPITPPPSKCYARIMHVVITNLLIMGLLITWLQYVDHSTW